MIAYGGSMVQRLHEYRGPKMDRWKGGRHGVRHGENGFPLRGCRHHLVSPLGV